MSASDFAVEPVEVLEGEADGFAAWEVLGAGLAALGAGGDDTHADRTGTTTNTAIILKVEIVFMHSPHAVPQYHGAGLSITR
jgi:hypothetical protein